MKTINLESDHKTLALDTYRTRQFGELQEIAQQALLAVYPCIDFPLGEPSQPNKQGQHRNASPALYSRQLMHRPTQPVKH